MAFPASRASSGALNSQAASTIEAYAEKVHDIVRKEMLLVQLADKLGFYHVKQTSHHRIDNVIESEDSQATAFNGFDTLPNGAPKGSQGVYWDYKNYAAPVAWALTDDKDMNNPFTVVDQLEVRTYKALVGLGKRIDQDMVIGNTADSKKINGLEQMIYAANAATTTAMLNAKRWEFRQATNTFGGVARTAFTADGVGGTNWENVSANFKASVSTELTTSTITNNNRFGYQITATVPNGTIPTAAYQLFEHVYLMCTYGIERPNLILSSTLPYEDYSRMGAGLVRYTKTSGDLQSLNLGFGDISYKGADWGFSENFLLSGLNGGVAGNDAIYMLNTDTIELEVTEGCDFVATDWVPGQAQLASTMYMYWRGQFVCTDPRKNAVCFNYNG